MKYYQIPGLSKGYSQLVMGSDYFKPNRYEIVRSILDTFVSLGGNAIDTAYSYGRGESEEALGMWLEDRGRREDLVILTKGCRENWWEDRNKLRVNPEAIRNDLYVSLERLKTKYVDLWAFHRDDESVPVGPLMEELNNHIRAGRIRAIGASNWTVRRIEEANEYAAKHGLVGFSFSSPNLSLAKPKEPVWPGCISIDEDSLSWYQNNNFPIFSWSSMARGFFSGSFNPDNPDYELLVRSFQTERNLERKNRAEQLAKLKNVSTPQIALAYVLNQPFQAATIIGPHSSEETLSSFEASKVRLSGQELRWLDLLT